MLIAEYASKNTLPQYAPKAQVLQELQDLYHCLQNLKGQLTQTQNYLENRAHLSETVGASYSKLSEHIKQEISNIELAIDNLIANNSEIQYKLDNMQTIPGIGKITAVAILAETPDFNFFTSARELAAYAGLTPKQKTSGTSVKGRSPISKIGSARLRQALYFPAIVAKRYNPIFSSFTQKLASKGKPNKVIIVAIMRKLLHIVFAIIKYKTQFNSNLLLDS